MMAGAPSQAAMRLEQSNRLGELEVSLKKANKALSEAEQAAVTAQKADSAAREAERTARQARDESEKTFVQAQRHLVSVEQENSRRVSRVNSIKEADERLAGEAAETKARVDAVRGEIAELPDTTKLDNELAEERSRVEGLRQALGRARGAYDSLKREAETRSERLAAITTESGAWQLRVDSASTHVKELDDRLEETKLQLKAMLKGPENIEGKRIALLEELEKADEARKFSSDTLVTAEQALASKDTELRTAQVGLNEVRERQIRLDAGVEAASERRKEVALLVGERFDCPPTHVLEKVGVESSDDLEPQSTVEVSLERLKRERDRLGAVNLRAEEELSEIDEQIGHMISERGDLEEAIARLRGAINSLNKEGRERLLAAFEEVNQHFIDLFRSLFGGGEAHLKLTESEDPLDAGLEIFASPPGKKMQSLSLLSGGEQTLTATSLIFAVFMTNPAPICVLDEVDAPLDDANVERFCNLLDDMRARTDTRFLIVTHNALTMSRMSRLFGVTMAERGVSQLVSVDLEEASEIAEAG